MSTQTKPATWNIDLAHSGVNFSVRHMVISKVRGKFGKFRGELRLDDADLTKSSVEVEIDTPSIDTGIADRDAHLRSADFFDVEQFPAITFASRRVESVSGSDGRYRVVGDLTIRGTKREVVLDVEYGGIGRDPWGNQRVGFTARTHVDRGEFGLKWNQVLEAGGVLVGERIDIEIELEAVKAAAHRAA